MHCPTVTKFDQLVNYGPLTPIRGLWSTWRIEYNLSRYDNMICQYCTRTVHSDQDSGGTDNAKISRKRSKPDKYGHGNGKECTRAGRMLSKRNPPPWQSYTSPNAPIGGNPQGECHADARKHTKIKIVALKDSQKKHKGQDQRERVTESGPRSFSSQL
ncbi:hypothetical protein Tco_0776920 [Tanacetum coccineum]